MAFTQTATTSGKYIFRTAGKFVDSDIEFIVPVISKDNIKVDVNTSSISDIVNGGALNSSTGYYSFDSDILLNTNAILDIKTAGWLGSSINESLSISSSSSVRVKQGGANVTINGQTSAPVVVTNTSDGNVSVGTINTTKPEYGYYISVKGSADAPVLNTVKNISEGYISTSDEIISSIGTITATEGSNYYIPVVSGTISTASNTTDLTGWTENTTAIVPTKGVLKISEGYYPNTFISLATLIPDLSEGVNIAASDYIQQGYTAYDTDGNVISGSLPIATSGNLNIVDNDSTAVVLTKSSNSDSYVVSASITANTSPTEKSIVETTGISGTDTSANVGIIPASKALVGTTDVTDTASTTGYLLNSNGSITITAGYYDKDLVIKAPEVTETPSSENITGHINVNGATLDSTEPTTGSYITLSGYGTMTAGNIYNGTYTEDNRYISIYDGEITLPDE